ncbi:MAG: hypothetical protein K6A97_08165 [Lachnospiraceae bacterium]|jgi:hypothetical protein|nr:hypothetical protein [Lachnospiraceae bacterium]
MIIIETVLLGCALYILFLTVKMKKSREIPSFFVNPKIDLSKARDKEGFIDNMTGKLFLFSALLILFSGISLLSEYVSFPDYVSIITNVAYIAMLVYYAVVTVKAQNKYLL